MAIRRTAFVLATLLFTGSAFAKDVYLSITGTVGNFRTDARIFNPSGTKDISITATFLPVGNGSNASAQSTTITIPKRQMRVLDDVVAGVFNLSGLGAIRLSSADDFVATARIYAQTATGTLGQFVPGLDTTQALSKGVLIQLKSSGAFRTNVGAVNPNGVTANVTWRLYDKNNALIATSASPVVMPPFAVIGPTNVASTFFFTAPAGTDLSDAWVSYQSDQPIFAYASVIDNATTDPTFIPALPDSGETIVTPPPATAKSYNVTLQSFAITFSPTLDIKQGDKVTFHIVNDATVIHGVSVIDTNGNVVVPAVNVSGGGKTVVDRSFTATTQGTYTAFCTVPSCGSGHDAMFTTFDVTKASGDGDRPGY